MMRRLIPRSSIRQSVRLLTGRLQVRVLSREPKLLAPLRPTPGLRHLDPNDHPGREPTLALAGSGPGQVALAGSGVDQVAGRALAPFGGRQRISSQSPAISVRPAAYGTRI